MATPPPSPDEVAVLSTEIVFVCDNAGTIVWADDRAIGVVDDLVGRRLDAIVVLGNEAKAGGFLRAATATGGSEPWELGIVGRDGPMTVRLRGSPRTDGILVVGALLPGNYGVLLADAGDLTHELLVLQRESERQRRALAAAHDALQRAQGQLVQGEQLRALGLLVASVAHEANNPLAFAAAGVEEADRLATFALSMLEAYRARAAGAAARETHSGETDAGDAGDAVARLEADPDAAYLGDLPDVLADARDGIERVRTLVLDLRTFARVDEVERKSVDLAATVRATLRVGCTAVPEGVQVEIDLQDVPPLECAPARVNQALLNLFTNAARAAGRHGSVRVRLREGVGEAVIEVEDTGPGVPPELRERVFEPFFTTHASTDGLGLGLHIAREVARAHGGEVSIDESDLGGARFRLTLPRAATAPPVD